MIAEFLLPDLGEGLPEAEIVQWHVAEGDDVTLNQTIADVETAQCCVQALRYLCHGPGLAPRRR